QRQGEFIAALESPAVGQAGRVKAVGGGAAVVVEPEQKPVPPGPRRPRFVDGAEVRRPRLRPDGRRVVGGRCGRRFGVEDQAAIKAGDAELRKGTGGGVPPEDVDVIPGEVLTEEAKASRHESEGG